MKKLIALLSASIIITSCSDDDGPNIIRAEEYGIHIRDLNNEIPEYSYRFFDYNTGETFHEGVALSNVSFAVSENERDYVTVRVSVEEPSQVNVFYISRNGNLYLNGEDSPDATSIFEINDIQFLSEINAFEGTIPLERDESFWVENSGNFNNN